MAVRVIIPEHLCTAGQLREEQGYFRAEAGEPPLPEGPLAVRPSKGGTREPGRAGSEDSDTVEGAR